MSSLSPFISSALSVPSATNFQTLALFICKLFIGGRFRNGHTLFDPNVFDDHLTTELDSICTNKISWHSTDVTQPSLLPWNVADHTEHILQLIFFDPKHLAKEIDLFKEYFSFYRIFLFDSTDGQIDTEKATSEIKKLSSVFDSNTLIVSYDKKNGDVRVKSTSQDDDLIFNSKTCVNQHSTSEDIKHVTLFDRTFGENERKRPMGIKAYLVYGVLDNELIYIPGYRKQYLTNYFGAVFNTSNVQMTFFIGNATYLNVTEGVAVRNEPKRHKDLSVDYTFVSRNIE